jgi:CspA family cold shock protein
MRLGIIKYYSPERGFGFVRPENGGASVFFYSDVLQHARVEGIATGLKVYFETAADPRRGTEWVEKMKPAGAPIASKGTTPQCRQARFKHHTRAPLTRSARRSAMVGGGRQSVTERLTASRSHLIEALAVSPMGHAVLVHIQPGRRRPGFFVRVAPRAAQWENSLSHQP